MAIAIGGFAIVIVGAFFMKKIIIINEEGEGNFEDRINEYYANETMKIIEIVYLKISHEKECSAVITYIDKV